MRDFLEIEWEKEIEKENTDTGSRLTFILESYKREITIHSSKNFLDYEIPKDAFECYGLARVGPYSFAHHYVAFRDNTKWCAAVVSKIRTFWGEDKKVVFQNHAVSICEGLDGNFISEDEAHYICAILNAPIVEEYILNSSDLRSFKIRPPVKIPKYDETNIMHSELSELSKSAHRDPTNI